MRIPALLLFLCACSGKDQTDTSADDTALVDADGDGFPADVDWDYPAADLPLSNGDGTIILYNGTTKIDTVTYDNGVTFPDPTGASMALRSTGFSATKNDTGSYWCTSTSSIGGVTTNDKGTPGAKNDSC